jgi:hypothetical protein
VRGEDALSVGVDLFGEVADAGLLFGRGGGKGEGFEAAGFVVTGHFQPSMPPCASRPDDMHSAGEDTEEIRIVERDANQLVVRRYRGVEELKGAMLGGFHGGDVARQAGQALRASLCESGQKPPVVAVGLRGCCGRVPASRAPAPIDKPLASGGAPRLASGRKDQSR